MVQFLFAATFQEFHLIRALYNSFIGTGIFNLNLSVSIVIYICMLEVIRFFFFSGNILIELVMFKLFFLYFSSIFEFEIV